MGVRGFLLRALSAAFALAAGVAVISEAPSATAAGAGSSENQTSLSLYEISDSETELSSDDLTVSIVSSTSTDLGQSLQVSFSTTTTAFRNRTRYANVYISCDDPEFSTDLPSNENEEDMPVFEATLFRIQGTKSAYPDVVVPRYMKYGTKAKFHITSVAYDVVRDGYENIESILLPDSIEVMPSGAFQNVPSTVTIRSMSESMPSTWAEDWTDAENIEYGYSPSDSELNDLDGQSSTGTGKFGNGATFIIGYNDESSGVYEPLVVTYDVVDSSGNLLRNEQMDLPLRNAAYYPYDAVGTEAGDSSTSFYIDVTLGDGESIDCDTVVFHNIYRKASESITPDLEEGPHYSSATKDFSTVYDLGSFITVEPSRSSSFSGYTQVDIKVGKVAGIYEELMPSVYESNKALIDSGVVYIRYQFASLGLTSYLISYKSGSETVTSSVPVSTPVDYCILDGDQGIEVGFLLDDSDVGDGFSYDSLVSVLLQSFTVKLDLYDTSTNSITAHSAVSTRFGSIYLTSEADPSTSYTDLGANAVITILSFEAAYFILVAIYFLYAKNRYKNDEFRRVKPRSFWKTASKYAFGLGLICMAVFFIVARWGVMDTSVVVYNPLDVYVIVFGILGIIFLGVAIRDLVVLIKSNRKRREAVRLHLGEDRADDGTLA
jgi:hypothetical protein